MAQPMNSNPFLTDDGDYSGGGSKRSDYDNHENQRRQLQDQISASEDRQIESSRRALASLAESESMGITTAEELLRQGEQLNNIERKTSDINTNMTTTQKHLNNIKSVFGGIKNWWNKGKPDSQPTSTTEKPSLLKDTLEKEKQSRPTQDMTRKNIDTSGFYDDDDLDKRFMAGAKTQQPPSNKQYFQPVTQSAREEEINENLGLMSDGLARLKGLALGMHDEIDKQNQQIDDKILPGIERANLRIEDQNSQMRKILRK